MKDLPSIRESLIEKIKMFVQELHEEVIALFKLGNGESGEIAFNRWSIRFRGFLERELAQEIPNYEKALATGRKKLSLSSEYENFMRIKGNSLLEFLSILIEEIEKGFMDAALVSTSNPIKDSVEQILSKDNVEINREQIVFVVHGRNLKAKEAVFEFLRSIHIYPLEFTEARKLTGNPTPYIGEILDKAFSFAQAIIILMTPDDIGCLREQFRQKHDPVYERNLTPQARPNVIFEAGMAMGRNSKQTLIIELGMLRPFSDISGRHVLYLNDTIDARQEFINRLKSANCKVNTKSGKWKNSGSFTTAIQGDLSKSPTHELGSLSDHKNKTSRKFDVFLCYNSEDRDAVTEIGLALKQRGISPWLDIWELRPGLPWHHVLEKNIQNIGCLAVFVGKTGIGPWENRETEAIIREFVAKNSPVIPILFANVPPVSTPLPFFLREFTWIDFRKGDPDPMEQLIWGITGSKEFNAGK